MMDDIWVIIGALRYLTRLSLGGYFLFQGLNAFVGWVKIPTPHPALAQFLSVFSSVPGFMLAVKVGQIVSGIGLILGEAVGLCLLILGIHVFGIFQLQWHFNHNKRLALGLGFFYLVTVFLHIREVGALL